MYVGVAVLLQQLLLVHAEYVHPIGVESQEQVIRQVGQQVGDALDLQAVEEVAPVHRPVAALLDEQDLQLLEVLADEVWPQLLDLARPLSDLCVLQPGRGDVPPHLQYYKALQEKSKKVKKKSGRY